MPILIWRRVLDLYGFRPNKNRGEGLATLSLTRAFSYFNDLLYVRRSIFSGLYFVLHEEGRPLRVVHLVSTLDNPFSSKKTLLRNKLDCWSSGKIKEKYS